MTFDLVRDEGSGLRYGILRGGERTVLIKVGLGGDVCGYANKYLHIRRFSFKS